MSETPTELALIQAVRDMAGENSSKVLPAVLRTLQEFGIRGLAAAVGSGDQPQVVITVSVDDVTLETVKHVTAPILRKVGFAEDVIPIMAGAAGSAVSRALAAQRMRRAAQASQAQPQQPAPPQPQEPPVRPAWTPGPRPGRRA